MSVTKGFVLGAFLGMIVGLGGGYFLGGDFAIWQSVSAPDGNTILLNRFSGEIKGLDGSAAQPAAEPAAEPAAPALKKKPAVAETRPLPRQELHKLKLKGQVTRGPRPSLSAQLYNGSDWKLHAITVELASYYELVDLDEEDLYEAVGRWRSGRNPEDVQMYGQEVYEHDLETPLEPLKAEDLRVSVMDSRKVRVYRIVGAEGLPAGK